MSWGYVGVAAVGGGGDASAVNAQNRQTAARNKRIVEANLENRIRTGYQVGILNMQMAQQRMQHARMGADLGTQGLEVAGANQNNVAAAGQVGASVQVVKADIEMQLDQAKNDMHRSWDDQVQNYNTDLRTIIDQGNDAQQGADGQIIAAKSDGWKGALLQGAVAAGSAWLSNNMNLGLGKKATTGTSSPVQTGKLGSGYSSLGSLNTGFNLGSGLNGARF